MKKSDLKKIIIECFGELNEAPSQGSPQHIKQVVGEIMDLLDDAQLQMESDIEDILVHNKMLESLFKENFAELMLKGINHKTVSNKIEKIIQSKWKGAY